MNWYIVVYMFFPNILILIGNNEIILKNFYQTHARIAYLNIKLII